MLKEQVRAPIVDKRGTTWWQRNRKWAIPGLVVAGITLAVGFLAAIFVPQ